MRVKKKIEILKLLDTLEEAFNYIRFASRENSEKMLYDCVNSLNVMLRLSEENKISELIKKILNECNYIVDLIYNDESLNDTISLIDNYINELRNFLINKVQTKFEILFLPYKASMWDSLESIWEYANNDPDCNCHVMPIPYYELNSDRTIKNECYEGQNFKKNIEIIHYNEYCIEDIQPDIIYIHNPYDEYNKLTMINPRYFSKNIVNYTNMLVYVPYFVTGSCKDIKSIEYMHKLPGYINSDKIIAQSYNHKDILIANGYSEKKILSLGSPKIDYVIKNSIKYDNMNKNCDKKVFLISTGINDLLNHMDWIDEFEELILTFVSRSDVLLIWRPHPLTELTITTMRPNLIDKFKKIYNIIENLEHIIIDNTSDANEVINMSDALISDYSSILFQYIATEKPILSLIRENLTELNRIYCVDYLGVYSLINTNIEEFINIVVNNNDYKKSERVDRFKNSINNADGTCGIKIHNTIKEELYNEIEKFRKDSIEKIN